MWSSKTIQDYRALIKKNVTYLYKNRNSEFLQILESSCVECADFIQCSEGKIEKACEEL
jgi:hypothetical protein